ncbi:hypothetical protein [Candidatus Albibeggiatoa sp. nov. NOAA]|uniref:hypothetical protein n=1 Tax=Candidatus Albibeggiatoa sp. nov. NOAA TaxID=3162724 RepID=UPI0032FB4C54|nr:hypothetical protein [Thiotrichaceae bacterium]
MKNRKKIKKYRFNGSPYLDSKSTKAVKINDLKLLIEQFQDKLNNPNDLDDKKWKMRWLHRFEKELLKKQKGLELKKNSKKGYIEQC